MAAAAVVELEEVNFSETKALWVFGYGSLCWKPGFEFDKAVTGYVCGYSRKFWQGNITHRGTEKKSTVFGVAFAVSGEAAVPYLSLRECKLGGYATHLTTFYPCSSGSPFTVLAYIATPKNSMWLGDAPLIEIANQITYSSGPSGHNVEYLLRLANFMRSHFPDENDDHLFNLEHLVKLKVKDKNMCLRTLMGDEQGCIQFVKHDSPSPSPPPEEEVEERVDSFQYTARVPEKTLRCLNI